MVAICNLPPPSVAVCGISIVVIHFLPKEKPPVRFWYPAHRLVKLCGSKELNNLLSFQGIFNNLSALTLQ